MIRTVSLAPRRPSLPDRIRAAWRGLWKGPYTLKDPALAKALFGDGYESAAGIRVTPENAFTFSAVFDAVNQISSDLGKLPLNLHKRRKDGGSDLYQDSPLYWILKHEANAEQTAMVFRRTLIAHALTCHGGYAEIERNQAGQITGLWILTPDRVEPIRQKAIINGRERLGPLVYRIDGRDDQILQGSDVVHIHGLGYDGTTAYPVIDKARQTIGLALAMERFGGQYFGKGTVFGGWLETDIEDLDEEQKKEIRGEIERFRAAQDSAWRILVTGAGHKFHQFTSKASDAQFDESRIRQVEEVARFFRMPPHRLGVNTPGTVSYASVEQANIDYYMGPLLDWGTLVEQEFNRKLIPRLERRQQYIKHNFNAFLRGTTKDRYEALGIARDRGIINADEWRALEDWNPQEGGQGKLYLVQGAQVPLDKIAAMADAQIEKTRTPPPAAPPGNGHEDDERLAAAIASLEARIAAGDTTIAEAQTRIEELRGELAAAQAAEGATSEAAAAIRQALAEQQTIASTTLALVTSLRSDLAAAEAARAETDAALEAARAEVQVAQDAAAAERARREAEVARLQTDADAAARLAEAAETARQAAEAERAEADGVIESLRNQIGALEAAQAAALGEHGAAIEALRASLAALEADRDAAATQLVEAGAAAETARTAAQEAAVAAEAARAERDAAIEAQAALEQERDAIRARIEALEADRETERQQVAARRLATLAAHRGLVVDAMGRMVRREVENARRRQATPEKLRRWLAGFAELHEAICVEALTPAIRVHLAWRQGTSDPVTLATNLVKQHITAFEAQIRRALDAEPEEFHAVLDRVLTRWEAERPGAVADQLLLEEVRDVVEE